MGVGFNTVEVIPFFLFGILQQKSDNAVEVIRAIITDLRGAADEANNTVAENNARIEKIKKENEALNAIGEKNIRISFIEVNRLYNANRGGIGSTGK